MKKKLLINFILMLGIFVGTTKIVRAQGVMFNVTKPSGEPSMSQQYFEKPADVKIVNNQYYVSYVMKTAKQYGPWPARTVSLSSGPFRQDNYQDQHYYYSKVTFISKNLAQKINGQVRLDINPIKLHAQEPFVLVFLNPPSLPQNQNRPAANQNNQRNQPGRQPSNDDKKAPVATSKPEVKTDEKKAKDNKEKKNNEKKIENKGNTPKKVSNKRQKSKKEHKKLKDSKPTKTTIRLGNSSKKYWYLASAAVISIVATTIVLLKKKSK